MSKTICTTAPNEHDQHRMSCSLGAVAHVVLLMNECLIVYTGVILCCSCSLGAKLHVLLLINECVIVNTGVIS
jgi:hypothetical protein